MGYPFVKDVHHRYYDDMSFGNIVNFINEIKEIQKETDCEFYEAIQAYDLRLKTVEAKAKDEQYSMLEMHLSSIKSSFEDLSDVLNTPNWAKNLEMKVDAASISEALSDIKHVLNSDST